MLGSSSVTPGLEDDVGSESGSVRPTELNYTNTLYYCTQLGQLNLSGDSQTKDTQSPSQVVFPNNHVCLGFPTHYSSASANNDGMDMNLWLYANGARSAPIDQLRVGVTPSQDIANNGFFGSLISVAIALTMALFSHMILRSINQWIYEADTSGWQMPTIYALYLLCDIVTIGLIWKCSLSALPLVFVVYLTDCLFSLLWMDRIIHLLQWLNVVVTVFLFDTYLDLCFGKWHFLISEHSLNELDRLQ
ncbi:hypothetical protein RFI_14415 [Reticulomyxa filosa]|uniref:Uncharacterized protein n=1 Tax=Reticulomyxa filosa TaxID=46433 RepID=X6NBS8_RETFI|nr:hypothetical protein RFI_14415 [Reticulomyxa filosa]|eukprot:ETO22777.1 hypothetical protein RFI_14415 [Reticulomyxa filosa]